MPRMAPPVVVGGNLGVGVRGRSVARAMPLSVSQVPCSSVSGGPEQSCGAGQWMRGRLYALAVSTEAKDVPRRM